MEEAKKKRAETSLKASIIEFMRHRPFLWNPRHPSYKDNKRREREFQEFALQMECPVRELKRVWHVLRTNFFRAHKLMLDRPPCDTGRPESGLWKYYLAMKYILKGKDEGFLVEKQAVESSETESCSPAPVTTKSPPATSSDSSSSQSLPAAHLEQHGFLNTATSLGPTNTSPIVSDLNTSSSSQQEPNKHGTGSDATQQSQSLSNSNTTKSNICHSNNPNKHTAVSSKRRKAIGSCLLQPQAHHPQQQAPNYFYPVDDEDYLYARSLGSTLKRFDFKTRELIKLKFQEIIVSQTQQLHQDDMNTVLH